MCDLRAYREYVDLIEMTTVYLQLDPHRLIQGKRRASEHPGLLNLTP